jgi:hypothetical protein
MSTLDELKQAKTILLIIVTIVALIAAGYAWYKEEHPTTVSKTQYVNIPQIKVVKDIKTVYVKVPQVETLSKPEAVDKLKLKDEDVAKNPDKQITTTAVVPAYDGKTNVISVMDTKTGQSEIIAKEQPLPFLAFENKREIGVRGGYSIKNYQEVDIYGRWDFVRIGNVHVGIYGDANSAGDAKAMISVGYKW